MFKKLAILTLIATPALAHQTTFSQPEYLRMSGGDPVAAQELSMFCSATGKSLIDCKDALAGNGNLKQEAARKCVQKMRTAAAHYNFPANDEAPGARGHQVSGVHWNQDYKTDADGEHRHAYSQKDRERAVYQYELILTRAEADRQRDNYGESTTSGSKEVDKHADWGIGDIAKIGAGFSLKEGESDTKSKGLSVEIQTKINEMAKAAYADPTLGEVKPSILCFKHEKTCTISGGGTVPNDSYEPEKNDSKGKKDDKKGADNTPSRHEEDPKDANGHVIDHDKTGTWAGNDTPRSADDPMIATTADIDLSAKSPMESCLDKEYRKLEQEVGSKTVDPNAAETEKADAETAKNLLKSGYCDESFYGRSTCRTYKIKQDSVVAVTIKAERKEAAASALKFLKTTGFCDAEALGGQFCRDQQTQWNTTPADRLIAPKPFKPGTPIRTLPGN